VNDAPVIVAGKRELLRLPAEVTRAVVKTTSAFQSPEGWREVNGAAHAGRNVWFIPVEREVAP
jgi:hypothetical protein